MESAKHLHYEGAFLGRGVQVCGIRNVAIGKGSCIGDDVWINVCIRDEKVRLRIGRCVLIGRRSVVSTGGDLEIGDYCITAPNVYIGDVDHDYRNDITKPMLLRGSTDHRKMVIEESCWIAFNAVVTGPITLGRGSVVGANSVVNRDVPPFSVVAGNPAKIVKMYDPLTKDWVSVKSPEARDTIEQNREKVGIPTREEYRKILSANDFERVDPVVAGGGMHL